MDNGHRPGDEMPLGVGLFCDEQGSTTLAAAVAILVSLALVFGMATAQWTSTRSADVQMIADAGALAGMDVVAVYVTIAQVMDALVLSLGFVGLLAMAIGLVLCALPPTVEVGPVVIKAAGDVLSTRARLARGAIDGLARVESALPYLAALNSYLTARANVGAGDCRAIAILYPSEGESTFTQYEGQDMDETARKVQEGGQAIEDAATGAREEARLAREALEAAWRADCGDGTSMYERAGALAGLQGAWNPYYPAPEGWDFRVAIDRAEKYYQRRSAMEAPASQDVAELTRSAARKAFYDYALSEVRSSCAREGVDGTVSVDLHGLPRNLADLRSCGLYQRVIWPTTLEVSGRVVHASAACPGASGASAGAVSMAQVESGQAGICPVCGFDAKALANVGAVSSSVSNGFEYHWRLVVEASKDYQKHRNEQARLEGKALPLVNEVASLWGEALASLGAARVRLCPPGRFGCVCFAFDFSARTSPGALASPVSSQVVLPARIAVAGAVLATDSSSDQHNVLGSFMDGLAIQGGFWGGAGGVADTILAAWGGMLESYGGAYDAFQGSMDQSFESLELIGLGGIGSKLEAALTQAIELAGLQPPDMDSHKPVLTNSSEVLMASGHELLPLLASLGNSLSAMGPEPGVKGLAQAMGVALRSWGGPTTVSLGEFQVPGTELTIPLEVDLADILLMGEAA